MQTSYDKDYFERGIELGISNYENYHWLGKPTLDYCRAIIKFLHLKKGSTLLDFGCAKGYYVKAFRLLGIDAWGSDASEYAISNCDPDVQYWLEWTESWKVYAGEIKFDLIFCKDVLEHISNLDEYLVSLRSHCRRVFIGVPLGDGARFLCERANQDKTHIHCRNGYWWSEKLNSCFPYVWRTNIIPYVQIESGYCYFIAENND
jgi:SAM-dependent methyltransferase